MKIKFLKEYRALQEDVYDIYEAGIIENMPETAAQWLIDNGFAKEVKGSGWWKPENGDVYYIVYPDGLVASCTWDGCTVDMNRFLNGAVFKTKEAARRWRDYLKAIATVRQDEGVLTPEEAAENDYVYYICIRKELGPVVYGSYFADGISVNTVLFDTREHAQASRDKHLDEWKIIANYDWSRE